MVNRRRLLQGSAALLAAPAIISRAFAQSKFDWQQCKGQTIVVTMSKNPRADTLQKYQKEFEALTGIKVESEQMPEQQQRSKAILELSTGRPSFDVLHYSLHVSKRRQREPDRTGFRLQRFQPIQPDDRHSAGWTHGFAAAGN
jgi:multiple sugar transport system substrate-binding protein